MRLVFDALRRVPFGLMDVARRGQGNALGAFGFDPRESAYRLVGSGPFWRLRDYADAASDSSLALLIVAAPIKRPYVWDLTPSASAIRYCLSQRWRVYLLEWIASGHPKSNGLDECVRAISECVSMVSTKNRGAKPFLIGHSLGGTLATIFGTSEPENIQGLVLLSAPLCFQPEDYQFRDALVSLIPPNMSDAEPCPGSLLSYMSALASPDTFVWSRLKDAVLSADRWSCHGDSCTGRALGARRSAASRRLVHQIIEWLYRENRLCRELLRIGEKLVGPSRLSASTLAIVNAEDAVAPLASVKPFTEVMPTAMCALLNIRARWECPCSILRF